MLAAVVATTSVGAAPYPQIAGLTAPMSGYPMQAGDASALDGLSGQQNGPQSAGGPGGSQAGGRAGNPMATGPMGVPKPQAGPPKQPGGNPNQGAGAGAAANAGNNTRCAADIDRLASGIQQNILDQQGEQVSVQAIANMMQNSRNGSVDMLQFMTMKAQLLSFVTAGISVRENNQALAPPGNVALPGLGKVASAQQMELSLSSSLSGDKNIDMPTIQTLQNAFAGGMKQNMQNLLDATQGCATSDVVAQRGVQAAQGMGLRAVQQQPM